MILIELQPLAFSKASALKPTWRVESHEVQEKKPSLIKTSVELAMLSLFKKALDWFNQTLSIRLTFSSPLRIQLFSHIENFVAKTDSLTVWTMLDLIVTRPTNNQSTAE